MAKTKKPRGRPKTKRPRQEVLPEMAASQIHAIENAADDYVDVRDNRMGWTQKEIAAKQSLMTLMKEHHLKSYLTANEQEVVYTQAEKEDVKVRSKKDNKKADSNGEAE